MPVEPVEPVDASLSEHEAVLPPLLPAQLHDHGPLPLTVEAVPAVQRLAVGAVLTVAPFEQPHAPFTGARKRPSSQSRSLWSRRCCRRNSMTTGRCR